MTAATDATAAPAAPAGDGCPLCGRRAAAEHQLVWQDDRLHVVRVDEPGQPCFFRVVWNAHVAEISDLDPAGRAALWRVLLALETAIRRAVEPAKMNLASLGNQVPHLHWHVIGRWPDDPHFPASVWSAPVRAVEPDRHRTRRRAVDAALPSIRDALSRDAAG